MGTHPIFESDFDCLTDMNIDEQNPEDFPYEGRGHSHRFFCRFNKGSTLLGMLKGLMISNTCMVTIVANPDGMTLIAEYQQCIQGSCHLTRNCFEEINFPDDFLKFSVQGQDLLSALSIVPGGTLELSMIEEGEPLTLKVIDEGVVLDIHIQTFDAESALDLGFERTKKVPRLVLESGTLRQALEHWDVIGMSTKVRMSPDDPKFSIISKGIVGEVQIDFKEQLVNKESAFRCSQLIEERYQTNFLKAVLGPCRSSTHVSFRIDPKGILQVQHLLAINIHENATENVFLTFFVNSDVI